MGAMTFIGKGDRPPLKVAVPPLYSEHTVDGAIEWFGGIADGTILCDGEWVVLREVVLCFTHVGLDVEHTGFKSCTSLRWCAEREHEAAPGDEFPSVPIEVRASTAIKPLLLFVKVRQGSGYLFVGEMEPSGAYGTIGPHGGAMFDLTSILPSKVWRRLGGAPCPGVSESELDKALLNLSHESNPDHLCKDIASIVAYWHGGKERVDGVDPVTLSDLEMPEILRWWLVNYGASDVICCPNYILPPEYLREPFEIEVEPGHMVFALEQQGVWQYSTLVAGNDPQVWIAGDYHDGWLLEEERLSVFLAKSVLLDGIWRAPYGATAKPSELALKRLVARLPSLQLRSWRFQYSTLTFHGGNGAYAIIDRERQDVGGCTWIEIGAISDETLQFLHEFDDVDWQDARF